MIVVMRFQNTDNRISPYKRTTEGTSTLLDKPVMNLMEQIKKERKIEMLNKQKNQENLEFDIVEEDADQNIQTAILQSISKNKK